MVKLLSNMKVVGIEIVSSSLEVSTKPPNYGPKTSTTSEQDLIREEYMYVSNMFKNVAGNIQYIAHLFQSRPRQKAWQSKQQA